jgi:HSP20 family protein
MYNKSAYKMHCNNHVADHYRGREGQSRRRDWKEKYRSMNTQAPVNVKELDDKYELYLFAPGYEKKDFLIALVDRNLSISVEDKKQEQDSWRRMEYRPKGFVRQFELNDKIDIDSIEATYTNGVLIVSLAKLEGFESSRQEIEIS